MVGLTNLPKSVYTPLGFKDKVEWLKFVKDKKISGRAFKTQSDLIQYISGLKTEKLLNNDKEKLQECRKETAELKTELKYGNLENDLDDEEIPKKKKEKIESQKLLDNKKPVKNMKKEEKKEKEEEKIKISDIKEDIGTRSKPFDFDEKAYDFYIKNNKDQRKLVQYFKIHLSLNSDLFDLINKEPEKVDQVLRILYYEFLNFHGITTETGIKKWLAKNHPDKLPKNTPENERNQKEKTVRFINFVRPKYPIKK